MSLHIVYVSKRFSKHKKIVSIVFLGMSGTFETFSSIKYEFLEICNIILTSKIQYLRKLDYSKNSIMCVCPSFSRRARSRSHVLFAGSLERLF
jgi:fluoride ion exporter CrcB/FEX